jgi:oligopeptide/dipeptide ABC transporter ATP-binding protein
MIAAPPNPPREEVLLEVRDLRTHFPVRRGLLGRTVGHVRAVDGISFTLGRGKTLGLVGESGCGKTTAGRTILRLIPATSGEVRFEGQDVFALPAGALRRLREHMQIIFQDPYGSLNPRMTIGGIIGEPLKIHGHARGRELERRVADLLDRVGLSPSYRNRYPHEFSGGQRQRIGIARALALEPRLIVCDEPVSALDVSIQAQILTLLEKLQAQLKLAYLFIAHDLAVVSHISNDVAVMYLGKIVEKAPSDRLYENPLHPYTKCLMSAIPKSHPATPRQRLVPKGEVPSAMHPPPGCPFHPRCPWAFDRCPAEVPALRPAAGEADHLVSCHLYH